jgi:hypothetical protein
MEGLVLAIGICSESDIFGRRAEPGHPIALNRNHLTTGAGIVLSHSPLLIRAR